MSDAAGMNHRIDPNGIVHVVFDRPDDKVNLLTPDDSRDLGELLDSVRHREDVRGLIFKSAKPGNVHRGDGRRGDRVVHRRLQGGGGARFGQIVFQKIADLPVPSACAINGDLPGRRHRARARLHGAGRRGLEGGPDRASRDTARDHPRFRRHAAAAAPGGPGAVARPDPLRSDARREASAAARVSSISSFRRPTSSARRSGSC